MHFRTLFALATAVLLQVVTAASASAADKPNILLIFVDDMGAADLGCFGSDLYRTPNIDRLATQGEKFTRAYAGAPVCSPSRAALMTGKASARLHLTDYLKGDVRPYAKLKIPDWTMALPETEATLGTVLRSQGYATAWLGKWHLGGDTLKFGFDAGKQDWNENTKKDSVDPKGVFTLTKEAMSFIDTNPGKPFFVGLSHYSPHGPLRFDEKLQADYQKIIDEKRPHQTNAGYAAMIEALDTSVGQMLEWLDKKGLSQNTLVIFYSDNGGVSNFTNNYPLREQKGTLYEGGVRVPMIARWPGHITAGSANDTRFCTIDMLPTLATITGAQAPTGLDGKDLSPVFVTGRAIDRGTLFWHYPHYHNGKPSGSILKGDWKLIEFFEDSHTELYNLADDPSETKDLAKTNPDKAAELLAEMKAWRAQVGAQMPTPNPDYDPAREKEGPPKKPKPDKAKKQKGKPEDDDGEKAS